MKAIVRKSQAGLLVCVKDRVMPGDYVINSDFELVQVNQSTCIGFTEKILGPLNPLVLASDGEEVEVLFKCAMKSDCQYPFCSRICKGNEGFYILGKEDRGY